MGQRTVYYQSRTGESLSNHMRMDYPDFRLWILTQNRNSIQEFDERLISSNLEIFLNKNDALTDFQITRQEIIDELTTEYLLVYCDYGTGKDKFQIVGSVMATWRYELFKSQVLKVKDAELKALCSILFNGKSLINDNPFIPSDNNKVGFWTTDEQRKLKIKLKEYKKLFDQTEGFEYLISVLEETKDKNQELIIDIEE